MEQLNQTYDILELQKMSYDELYNLALWLFQKEPVNKGKQMLIYEILEWQDRNKVKLQPRKKVYLAAKISGLRKEEVAYKYEEAKKIVSSHGYEPVSPWDIKFDHPPTWHEAMRKCIPLMLSCDFYTTIDNHLTSVGVFVEDTIAIWTKFPKIHFNEFES